MSQTKVKIRRKKRGKRSVIMPTPEEIAAFAKIGTDEPDVMVYPTTPEAMQIIFATMRSAIEAEGAGYGVPCNGRGTILVAPNAKGDYVRGGADDGLKVTDDIVLVFDDVMLKPHSTEGEPPYVDPSRTDLCPNIRHVRLTDYLVRMQ